MTKFTVTFILTFNVDQGLFYFYIFHFHFKCKLSFEFLSNCISSNYAMRVTLTSISFTFDQTYFHIFHFYDLICRLSLSLLTKCMSGNYLHSSLWTKFISTLIYFTLNTHNFTFIAKQVKTWQFLVTFYFYM